jgi:hypothetical protein
LQQPGIVRARRQSLAVENDVFEEWHGKMPVRNMLNEL